MMSSSFVLSVSKLLEESDDYLQKNESEIISNLGGMRTILQLLHNAYKSDSDAPNIHSNINHITCASSTADVNRDTVKHSTTVASSNNISNVTAPTTNIHAYDQLIGHDAHRSMSASDAESSNLKADCDIDHDIKYNNTSDNDTNDIEQIAMLSESRLPMLDIPVISLQNSYISNSIVRKHTNSKINNHYQKPTIFKVPQYNSFIIQAYPMNDIWHSIFKLVSEWKIRKRNQSRIRKNNNSSNNTKNTVSTNNYHNKTSHSPGKDSVPISTLSANHVSATQNTNFEDETTGRKYMAFADRLSNFLLSKYVTKLAIPLSLVLAVIIAILNELIRNNTASSHGIPYGIMVILYLLYLTFYLSVLFTFDKIIFLYQLFTFETIYKLLNALLIIITVAFRTQYYNGIEYLIPRVIIMSIMIIFMVSIDAWHVSNKYKLVAIVSLILVLVLNFFGSFEQAADKEWYVLGRYISLRDIQLSATANLVVFFIKQLCFMVKEPNKASVISMRPALMWCDGS